MGIQSKATGASRLRVQIQLSPDLLKAIDRAASDHGEKRSYMIRYALRKEYQPQRIRHIHKEGG